MQRPGFSRAFPRAPEAWHTLAQRACPERSRRVSVGRDVAKGIASTAGATHQFALQERARATVRYVPASQKLSFHKRINLIRNPIIFKQYRQERPHHPNSPPLPVPRRACSRVLDQNFRKVCRAVTSVRQQCKHCHDPQRLQRHRRPEMRPRVGDPNHNNPEPQQIVKKPPRLPESRRPDQSLTRRRPF